jgi:putative Flp pilus-assembly TadE/G-like protein
MQPPEPSRMHERGATLVVMAVVVFLALGMAAMALDYGMIKTAKAEAQRAMDAAALAGASAFQGSGTNAVKDSVARARAKQYATKNIVGRDTVRLSEIDSILVDQAKERVDVYFTRTGIPTWFARSFGTASVGIHAHAAAEAEVGGVIANCIKPFLIPDLWQETSTGASGQDKNSNRMIDNDERWSYEPGGAGTDRYLRYDPTVTDDPSSPQTGYGSNYRQSASYPADAGLPLLLKPQTGNSARHGNWYYTLNGPEKNLREDIEHGCITAGVGDPPELAKGGKTGQVRQGVQYLVSQDPTASWDPVGHQVNSTYGDNSPRVIIVGLLDPVYIKGTSKTDKPDAGARYNNFAKVFLESVNGNDDITARFVGFVSGGGGGTPSGTLVKVLRLVQ